MIEIRTVPVFLYHQGTGSLYSCLLTSDGNSEFPNSWLSCRLILSFIVSGSVEEMLVSCSGGISCKIAAQHFTRNFNVLCCTC